MRVLHILSETCAWLTRRAVCLIGGPGLLLSAGAVLAANTGPQLTSFLSNGVFYAAVEWHDAESNLLTRAEVTADLVNWYSDNDTIPRVSQERTGDFNRWLYRINPDFFPEKAKFVRLTTSRPRPEATAGSVALDRDTTVVVDLTGTVPTGNASTLVRVITALPAHGTLYDGPTTGAPITVVNTKVSDPQGRVLYQPNAGFYGADSFSYKVKQGWLESANRLVPIRVREHPNQPPVITPTHSVELNEDTRAIFALWGEDPDNGPARMIPTVLIAPSHGSLFQVDKDGVTPGAAIIAPAEVTNPRGLVYYVPNLDYNGPDLVRYVLFDGEQFSDRADVDINVLPVNDAPVAMTDPVIIDEDTEVTFALFGTDVDGDALVSNVRLIPANGKLYQVEADGMTIGAEIKESNTPITNPHGLVHYVPNPNFNGLPIADDLRYDLFDGQTYSFRITVNIAIRPVNDPPWARAAVHVGDKQNPVQVILDAGDVDTPFVGHITAFPAKGKLYRQTVAPENLITQENPTFTSPDLVYVNEDPPNSATTEYTMSYYVEDELSKTDVVTDTIRVELRNQQPLPTGTPASVETTYPNAVQIKLNGVDPDGDSSSLLFTIVEPPRHGRLSARGVGVFVPITSYPFPLPASDPEKGWLVLYTPESAGPDSFSFTLTDEKGLTYVSDTGNPLITVSVNVLSP